MNYIKMIGPDCWDLITYYKVVMEQHDRYVLCLEHIESLNWHLKNPFVYMRRIFENSKDTSTPAKYLRKQLQAPIDAEVIHRDDLIFDLVERGASRYEFFVEDDGYGNVIGYRVMGCKDGRCYVQAIMIPRQYSHVYSVRDIDMLLNEEFQTNSVNLMNNFVEKSILVTSGLGDILCDFNRAYADSKAQEQATALVRYREFEAWFNEAYGTDTYSDAD